MAIRAHHIAFHDLFSQALERAAPRHRVPSDVEELFYARSMVEIHDIGGIPQVTIGTRLVLGFLNHSLHRVSAALIP